MSASRSRGFTLIELMIVVAVIGILAIIAIPSYLSQVRKSRRSDAISTMNTIALNEERWRTNCPLYADLGEAAATNCPSAGVAFMSDPSSSSKYYTFTVPTHSAIAYTVKAAASGSQLKDSQFGTACSTLYYSAGADAAVDTACSLSGANVTSTGKITQCPAACFGK